MTAELKFQLFSPSLVSFRFWAVSEAVAFADKWELEASWGLSVGGDGVKKAEIIRFG